MADLDKKKLDLNDFAETKIELNERVLRSTTNKLASDYRFRPVVRSSGGVVVGKPFVKLISITDDHSNDLAQSFNLDGLDEIMVTICAIFS